MLKSLLVKNYLLIDEITIKFDFGFTTITGETGAGKSIILGAISLILGERANPKNLRNKNNKSVIEASFDISDYSLQNFFVDNDLDYFPYCILRREILPSGKSRAFINDTPVNLTQLRHLATNLVDMHSQFANSQLANINFKFGIIDDYIGAYDLLNEYSTEYKNYNNLQNKLQDAKNKLIEYQKEYDYNKFQIEQLSQVKISSDKKYNSIKEELSVLDNAEEIKLSLSGALQILESEDGGAIKLLRNTKSFIDSVEKHSANYKGLSSRLESLIIELKDISEECDSYHNAIEINPLRIDELNEELFIVQNLFSKYNVDSISELKSIFSEFENKVIDKDSLEEEISVLEASIKSSFNELKLLGNDLSKLRKECSIKLESNIEKKLKGLGLPHARFRFNLSNEEAPNRFGFNKIDLLFNANNKRELELVEKVASGGEISRIMLCLKSLLSNKSNTPTIIFDEIDTGVSGEIADKMGLIMKEMGESRQVLSITHNPQVAARGNQQLKVYKISNENDTQTLLSSLNSKERVSEIASMLSGEKITDASIKNASELLSS